MSNMQMAKSYANTNLPIASCLLHIAYCLLFFIFPASAQHTIMRTYNINDGLVCNQIRGFYQDKKGFLWIMTWEGLSRYDGNTFRNYTMANGLEHPLINAMIEGNDGKMYIAENDGTIDVILNGEVQKGLSRKNLAVVNKFISEGSGRILAPSDKKGLCVFDEGRVIEMNHSGSQISISEAIIESEYYIICGYPSGVIRPDHSFIRQWSDSMSDYNCILKDDHNQIWVGTSNGLKWVSLSEGPKQYDLIPTSFQNTFWSSWPIRDMLQTSDGSIWIAALGGLIQIKPDKSWRLFNNTDGLPADYITSIFEDKSGFLWIGTDQGVAKLDIKNTIDIFSFENDVPSNNFADLIPTQDGGALILAYGSLLFKIKENQLQSFHLDKFGMFHEFLIIDNDTLVTTDKERIKINGKGFQPWSKIPYSLALFSSALNDSSIISVFKDQITLSINSKNYVDTTIKSSINTLSQGVDGEIWIGTSYQGLYQVKLRKNSLGNVEFIWQDFSDYLPEKTIRSLHVDGKGDLWIGTRYSGLIQLHHDSLTGKYITEVFDRKDGFISDFIKSITSDEDGYMWVGTNAGIEKLIPTKNGYRVFSFSRVHNFFATISKIVVGLDQSIWCITTTGIVRIKDDRYETISPSSVYITSVRTAKKNLMDPHDQLPFELKHDENYLDIEFSSNDQINEKQINYVYHLTGGSDTTWSKPQHLHKVSFANLLPGDYRFEVRALGWNGNLGKETAYQFSITPPYWQKTWFIILSILVLFALLYAFYRNRIRQIRQIQGVRDRIASDLHDEIGSSLTHVNILSEIGRKNTTANDQPQQLFKRIGEEVQSSSEALDDIIWSVSSRADTTEDLVSRMRRYAAELFDAKGISFSLNEGQLDQNQQLGLELRRDVYLIYKELLRNIVRHANATNVKVSIREENQFLWFEISDNGHGFNPDTPTDRHGIYSIKSRVAKWSGKFNINSSPESGTLIKFGLPVRTSLFHSH